METRVNKAKEIVLNHIKWTEEDLQEARERIVNAAASGVNADELNSLVKQMKDAENKLRELYAQKKVIEFINGDK